MLPQSFIQGLAMIFLGTGGIGAADVASYMQQPFVALGYLLASIVLLLSGIVKVVRAY
ncbi:MAG: hypothetical protein M5U22_15350 [Thermoleophilia bacterium]|nr:hypothetical protein [Thermoleophilia bacterium]